MNNILIYLDELYENPRCELNYNKDYEFLIAVMLSAQTTDKRVNMVTDRLFKKYNSLGKLMNAPDKEIEGIIKEIGTYHKKTQYIKEIAKILYRNGGYVPNDRKFLESLPGVGRKTTNVVLSELFNEDCIAVDTHVKRVSIRLGLVNKNDDVLVIEKKLMKSLDKNKWSKVHHQLVLFGRYYCKAINPKCINCKLNDICKYKKTK